MDHSKLKSLDRGKIPIAIGDMQLYLRYNLTARRYLEEYVPNYNEFLGKDSSHWTIDDTLHLLRAGLIDFFYEENEDAINKREFDKVVPSLALLGGMLDEAGLEKIVNKIIESLILSLPEIPAETGFQRGGQEGLSTI